MDQCWFQMVSGNFIKFWGPKMINWIELTAGRSYLLPTRFFFHTLFTGRRFGFLPHSVASSCPVALLKIVEQVFKKNTCLKWWCINIISEKTMLKDYCNSKFAGQKTKEDIIFFLHVRLKMRDWNWDNPSCIHHPWIGIIRCSMIFLYPLVESGCTTDRFRKWKKSGLLAAARHIGNYMAQNTTEKPTLMTPRQHDVGTAAVNCEKKKHVKNLPLRENNHRCFHLQSMPSFSAKGSPGAAFVGGYFG